jgi:hypothetical protein
MNNNKQIAQNTIWFETQNQSISLNENEGTPGMKTHFHASDLYLWIH